MGMRRANITAAVVAVSFMSIAALYRESALKVANPVSVSSATGNEGSYDDLIRPVLRKMLGLNP